MTIVIHDDWERWARIPGARRGLDHDAGALWAEPACELLRALWAEGLSASAIAARLGNGFSRYAVIGKARRLGLPGRRSPIGNGGHAPHQVRLPRASPNGGVIGATLPEPAQRRCAGCRKIFVTADLNHRHCTPCRAGAGARP